MAVGPLRNVLCRLREMLDPQRAAGLTDAGLLQRFAGEGDQAAFAQLVQRHGPMVLGVCGRILDEPRDVEDAFQAVFLVLIRKAGSLSRPERVGNWLHGVAYRTARKARTAAGRRRFHEQQVPPMPAAAFDHDCWRELRPVLDEELQRLPDKYRVPLVLCYLEGKTLEAAALDLGWPTGTVSGRLARARDVLRQRLTRRGVSLTAGTLATVLTQHAAAAVPVLLLDSILQAAVHGTAHHAGAAGAVSTRAVALAEGVSQAMFMSQVKLGAALLLTVGVIAAAIGLLSQHLLASAALEPGVAEPKARGEDKGKTVPPGVPLELRLTAKTASYPLDLGGKTEAEVRQLVEATKAINWERVTRDDVKKWDALPPAPAVDLEAELRNTGDKALTLWIVGYEAAANVQPSGLYLTLAGPAVVSAQKTLSVNTVFRPANLITLAAGNSRTVPLKSLATSICPGASGYRLERNYWLRPGVYTLSANLCAEVSPAPTGATINQGYGSVVITSAPVEIKVGEKK